MSERNGTQVRRDGAVSLALAGPARRMIDYEPTIDDRAGQLGQPPPKPLAFVPKDGPSAPDPELVDDKEAAGEGNP